MSQDVPNGLDYMNRSLEVSFGWGRAEKIPNPARKTWGSRRAQTPGLAEEVSLLSLSFLGVGLDRSDRASSGPFSVKHLYTQSGSVARVFFIRDPEGKGVGGKGLGPS